jgi:pyruvate/2-oxoglutarate dehydrogenase complex dihydrolipoamide acyltransferase (E2) component
MRTTDISANPDSPGIDGTAHYGYVWGKFDAADAAAGVPYGNQFPQTKWVHVHGKGSYGAGWRGKDNHNYAARYDGDGYNATTLDDALTSPQKSNPNGVSYGPLIGNPAMKDFVGMRVDGKGTMFWFPQEAPEWLTFPLRQAAALTAQAEKKAAEEAARADAAARAKQQADAAAEQARQDAANALAEKQAASEAKVAEAAQQTQAQQAMLEQAKAEQEQQTQAQQVLLERARAADAQRAIETEQYRQAGDILLERARRQQAQQGPGGYPRGYAPPEDQGYAPEGEDEGGGYAPEEQGSCEQEIPMDEGDAMYEGEDTGYPEEEE